MKPWSVRANDLDGVTVEWAVPTVRWGTSPRGARAMAAELLAAADEAESEPRFSEEDIDAISKLINTPSPAVSDAWLRQKLADLRKPRGNS